ncbi:MAG TPA: cytochrome P450 [Myxococcota bacterium]|nr:cytochrome P450 [Myxococcota bacterium]
MSEAAGARPFSTIPRLGFFQGLRQVLDTGGGRVDMLSGLEEQYETLGPVVLQLSGPFKLVNLFGPDAARLVLMDREQIFSAQQPWTQIMGRIFPNGLLLRDGAEHKHHRKIMHEAFTRPALREYVERMSPTIARGIGSFGGGGAPILAFRAYKKLTLEIAASIFVGMDLGPTTGPMNVAFENMVAASMSRVRLPLIGREFQRGLRGRKFMLELLSGMLEKKHGDAGPDMFSRLCRARTPEGEAFRDGEVLDHMIFLMMAAHDTTTSTLSSLTYELAVHPEWQERVREESRALGKAEPSLEELGALEGLSLAMNETLRRYPPLPVIPRINTADFEFGGYQLPAGCMVVVSPIHTHHMAEWWSEPFRWDPARFAPGRAEHERHTHSFTPFGGGPHMCLGLRFAEAQVRLVMHHLLSRYRWSVPAGYTMPVQQAPISKPRDGLPVRFTPLA